MPQVTVYIRSDDLDKWKAIEKKSEFIHKALNGVTVTGAVSYEVNKVEGGVSIKPIKTKEDAIKVVKEVFPEAKPITYKKTGNWGA